MRRSCRRAGQSPDTSDPEVESQNLLAVLPILSLTMAVDAREIALPMLGRPSSTKQIVIKRYAKRRQSRWLASRRVVPHATGQSVR